MQQIQRIGVGAEKDQQWHAGRIGESGGDGGQHASRRIRPARHVNVEQRERQSQNRELAPPDQARAILKTGRAQGEQAQIAGRGISARPGMVHAAAAIAAKVPVRRTRFSLERPPQSSSIAR